MGKTTYFKFMLENLGFQFEDNITLFKVRKDILYNLYKDDPETLKQITKGVSGRYRRKRHEDWSLLTYNNVEVPVCTRKFATIRGEIKLIDRNSEELKSEAKRIYEVLKENNKLQ